MNKAGFPDHTMPYQGIIFKVVNICADYKEDREDLLKNIELRGFSLQLNIYPPIVFYLQN
jgi:hypothetical protein